MKTLFKPILANPFILTVILALVYAIVKLLAVSHVGLQIDAAHYANYGHFLAWGYYDHPPMIGWLEGLVELFSRSDMAMRIVPVFCGVIATFLVYRITQKLYTGKWTPFLAACLIYLSFITNIYLLTPTPQAPLLVFSLMCFLACLRIDDKASTFNYVLLGIALGLCMLSEYTAVLLYIGVYFFYRSKPSFTKRGLKISVIISLVMYTPVIYWNVMHDFASFVFQLNHGTSGAFSYWKAIKAQLKQFILFNPFYYILAALAVHAIIKDYGKPFPAKQKLLLVFAATWFVTFFLCSFTANMIAPHWIIVGYVFLSPVVANYIVTRWHDFKWTRRFAYGCLILGGAPFLFLFGGIFPSVFAPVYRLATSQLYDWQKVSERTHALLQYLHHEHKGPLIVYTDNWFIQSRLTWYTGLPVLSVSKRSDNQQYKIWFGRPKNYQDGLLVTVGDIGQPENNSEAIGSFKHCQWLNTLTLTYHHGFVRNYKFYYCRGFIRKSTFFYTVPKTSPKEWRPYQLKKEVGVTV